MNLEMPTSPKTCATCAHRRGFTSFAQCAYTGTYADLSRKFGSCSKDFDGWTPRQGLLTRFIQFFIGAKGAKPCAN